MAYQGQPRTNPPHVAEGNIFVKTTAILLKNQSQTAVKLAKLIRLTSRKVDPFDLNTQLVESSRGNSPG